MTYHSLRVRLEMPWGKYFFNRIPYLFMRVLFHDVFWSSSWMDTHASSKETSGETFILTKITRESRVLFPRQPWRSFWERMKTDIKDYLSGTTHVSQTFLNMTVEVVQDLLVPTLKSTFLGLFSQKSCRRCRRKKCLINRRCVKTDKIKYKSSSMSWWQVQSFVE